MTTITRKYEELPAGAVAMTLGEGESLGYANPTQAVSVALVEEVAWMRAHLLITRTYLDDGPGWSGALRLR